MFICSRKRNCVTKFIRENYKEKMNIPVHTKESTDGHTLIGIVAFENLLGLTEFQSSFLSFVTFDIMIYCLKLLFSSCCCQLFLAPEDGLAYEPKYWANLFERIQALCTIIVIITDITLFIISSFCRRD